MTLEGPGAILIFGIGLAVLVAFLIKKAVKPLPAPRSIDEEKLWVYMHKRIDLAREAITTLRKDTRHWPDSPGFELSTFPLTYGFYGLLDYIELGDPEKIIDQTLRRFVQTAIRENARAPGFHERMRNERLRKLGEKP